MPSKIITGVDRLLDLVNDKKNITINEAALELGVSKKLVEEWANFLQEGRMMSINYMMMIPSLTKYKFSKKDLKKEKKGFEPKKIAFERKVESSLKSLEREGVRLRMYKKTFDDLQSEIEEQVNTIKCENMIINI